MTDFVNKIIEIKSKEEKKTKAGTNTTIFLTDQDKIKFVYWKLLKDGSLSQAAQQFKNMGLDEGSIVNISYVIETYIGADKQEHTSNRIIGFRETNEQPVVGQTPAPRPQPVKTQPAYTPVKEKDEAFWNNITIGKCQSLFLQAYIQSGKSIQDAKLQVVAARQLAELVVNGQQSKDEPLPEPPPEVDNIPF